MDEDAPWFTDALARAAPKLKLTIWRGVPPLMAWWLVVVEDSGKHFTLSHMAIKDRDEAAVTRALHKAKLFS